MNHGHLEIALNLVWVLMAGFLVMFMQVGFAEIDRVHPGEERGEWPWR